MSPQTYELFASCLAGLEHVFADELKRIGIKRVRPLGGGVAFYATMPQVLKVCLWSRLASRILLVVGRVDARNADAMYAGAKALAWEDVLAPWASIAISAHGTNDELRNTQFSALKVKDALCDRMREVCGKRPNVDTLHADASIDVHIHAQKATISLDLSGTSLYQRAYLTHEDSDEASLLCAYAAGLLALADWHKTSHTDALIDPACADGLLVCEAASIASDQAPGLTRDTWGFFGWSQFDETIWSQLLDEADDRFERGLCALVQPCDGDVDTDSTTSPSASTSTRPDLSVVRIVGLTASSPAIARAREHLKRAGLRQVASIELGDSQTVSEVVSRICAASGEQAHCLTASILETRSQTLAEAQILAQAAAFVAAASAVPAGSCAAALGGQEVRARYGIDPDVCINVGRDRIACEALLFRRPPASPAVVMVPDSSGGAEHRVEVFDQNAEQFGARLRKNAKERRKWAKREGITCYRIYDADLPDYAVAIDVYEGDGQAKGNTYLHIAEYAPPARIDTLRARRRFNDVLTLAPVVLGVRPDHVFSKTRRRDKGGAQYRDAGSRSYVTQVAEGGLTFEVDLSGYLDTGLFLDHRLTRQMVRENARDKRFLNLFAYTGSASVYAASGGAAETVTVDLSQTYLDWAQRNMEANGFCGAVHRFERADVLTWITQCRRTPQRFDLIFVDPPTFSNSKAMGKRTWDVQRDHVELLIGVSRLLAEGCQAIFSCNLRTFKPDYEALTRYGVELTDISSQTIPHDFERNARIHQCYRISRTS